MTNQPNVDLQGWFNAPYLYDRIASDRRFKKILEIGTWKGLSTCFMCKRLVELNRTNEVEFYAVDTFMGAEDEIDAAYKEVKEGKDIYQIYLNNIKELGFENIVKTIKGDSVDALSSFEDEYFDFIFIDGDHSYEGCFRDILAAYPKVKSGGILAGDDFDRESIKRAVSDAFDVIRKPWQVIDIDVSYNVIWEHLKQ